MNQFHATHEVPYAVGCIHGELRCMRCHLRKVRARVRDKMDKEIFCNLLRKPSMPALDVLKIQLAPRHHTKRDIKLYVPDIAEFKVSGVCTPVGGAQSP